MRLCLIPVMVVAYCHRDRYLSIFGKIPVITYSILLISLFIEFRTKFTLLDDEKERETIIEEFQNKMMWFYII